MGGQHVGTADRNLLYSRRFLQGVFTKKGSLFAQERQRTAAMLKRGLVLLTKVRKNMKALPLTLTDRPLLNARNMAETIIGHIKAFSSLSLPKHRAPLNAFLHLLAALTAYQLNPIKPTAPSFRSSHCQHKKPLLGLNK